MDSSGDEEDLPPPSRIPNGSARSHSNASKPEGGGAAATTAAAAGGDGVSGGAGGGAGGTSGGGGRSGPKRQTRTPAAHRDGHTTVGVTVTGKRSQRGGHPGGPSGTVVNFDKLRTETLHKVSKHYKLEVPDDETKQKLVHSIANHFVKEKVDESKVLVAFIAALSGSGSGSLYGSASGGESKASAARDEENGDT